MIHTFWVIYLGLAGVSLVDLFLKSRGNTAAVKMECAISLITWVGLFGYVTNNPILTPLIWKFVFIGALLWDILFTVQRKSREGDVELNGMPKLNKKTVSLLLPVVTIFPLYYGLFHYAF